MSELTRLSQEYRDYARFEMATHGSPIYAAICSGLADEPDVGGIGLRARPGFRTPLILLAAVHHLLLSGLDHPLARYYPSVVGDAARPIDPDLYPTFADLVRRHRDEVERLGSKRVGDRGSAVQISCTVEGALLPPVPSAVPRIAWRAGLDLNPLDVRDPDTVAWLRALVWPEHLDRMAILDAAIAIARDEPPALFRGDLVDDLAAVSATAPGSCALVVIDTWVLAYVLADRRRRFVAELRRLASHLARPIWLVACEGQSVTASLQLGLGAAPADGSGFSLLTLHRFEPGDGSQHILLAECHAHGRWIRWLDPDTAGAA